MKPVTVSVDVTFSSDELDELWDTTMIGTAVDYWAYQLEVAEYPKSVYVYDDGASQYDEGETDETTKYLVNAKTLLDGYVKLANGTVKVNETLKQYAQAIVFSKEFGDIDPDNTDVAVQAALFDEIVYG